MSVLEVATMNKFPHELWDKIFTYAMDDARAFPNQFARFIPVSKQWANLASPHLYQAVDIYILNLSLWHFAAVLHETPETHPRRTWVHTISTFAESQNDAIDPMDPEIASKIAKGLVVIVTYCSHLRNLTIQGLCLPYELGLVLSHHHGRALTSLDITLDPRDVRSLDLVRKMTGLRSLRLSFDFGSEVELPVIAPLSVGVVEPLNMPEISDFSWSWQHDGDNERWYFPALEGLRYLGLCRFHKNCQLRLDISSLKPDEMAVLNPLFVNYHSKRVRLNFAHPEDSAVLAHSQSVHFASLARPHPDLFGSRILPPSIRFDSNIPDQIDHICQVLETLTKSKYTHQTCIHIYARVSADFVFTPKMDLSTIPKPVHFTWGQLSSATIPEYDSVYTRFLGYAKKLIPNGVVIADCDMIPFEDKYSVM